MGTATFGSCYGVANEGGRVSLGELANILEIARAAGVNLLDTAISYGESEIALGMIGVSEFNVVTKLPAVPQDVVNVRSWAHNHIKGSLKRVGQTKLYGVLLHRPHDLFEARGDELAQALLDIKEVGLTEKVGVSIYGPENLENILRLLSIDLVQAPLNVIDRRLELSGWLQRLKNAGIEVHVRSPFLQGLLLMEREKIPQKFSRWSELWDHWHEKTIVSGVSKLVAALAYPLSLVGVDKVIAGVDSAAHLLDLVHSSGYGNMSINTSFMSSSDTRLVDPNNWALL